jgi:archaeosortase A (PGF-CTERM-specific)
MEKLRINNLLIPILFILIPSIFIIYNIIFIPDLLTEELRNLLMIPLFTSLFLLLIGFIIKKPKSSYYFRLTGWIFFAFFWSMYIKNLYYSEDGDFVNAFICIFGVFFLFYLSYHEWLSNKRKKIDYTLNWAAGVAAISGIIYFGIELTPVQIFLREIVAEQSAWLLNIFVGDVEINGVNIQYQKAFITIIFACTAVQSMVIFIGLILPLRNISNKRKMFGLISTVIPVYFLNLVRNASITFLVGIHGHDFFSTAHNIIGKGGSLIALIILLALLIKIIPEVFQEILKLVDLPKRNGPLEQIIKRILWRDR